MSGRDKFIRAVAAALFAVAALQAKGQLPGFSAGSTEQRGPALTPLTQPTLSPGVIQLLELEGKFSQAVAEGGGKAFAQWFADDAVVLNNGQPATMGKAAIAAQAKWNPKEYELTWYAQGAQMGPSNDMGFTWGHYEGRSKDKNGQPVTVSGRYMTVWKKVPDGSWKVAMDASSNEPPAAGECCALPKP
ncbi:MAG TPA: nuclear transport factor 2 family protein [Edaphobacter sp.]